MVITDHGSMITKLEMDKMATLEHLDGLWIGSSSSDGIKTPRSDPGRNIASSFSIIKQNGLQHVYNKNSKKT